MADGSCADRVGRGVREAGPRLEGVRPRGLLAPDTTLYWDFLARHRAFLAKNARMLLQLKNLDRLSEETLREIRRRAALLRSATA